MIARRSSPSSIWWVPVVVAVTAMPRPARAEDPPPAVASPAPPPAVETIPLRLAVALEAASGVVTGPFLNQLLGARLDGRFSEHLSLGVYVGAANLKGKDGRAHSALTYAALEYMAGDPALKVRFPLRFATGWLVSNGPVARVGTGMAIAAGKKVDLIGEIASMVWLTNNQNLLSIDLSIEVAYRF
ncbi:MAG TPA: hypothetical protein VHK47_17915 [Polyangia bacterium]|jgi:hypothetical protein|nr:hypothetical protein [Polyangia bacterium]